MKPTETESFTPALRRPAWGWLLALAALIALLVSLRHRSSAPAVSLDASVERKELEIRDGRFHAPGASMPFTGWVLDYYTDGSARLQSAVVDGRLHGESTGWFTNGAVELQEQFQSGLAHGTRTTWHPNGQKRSEGQLREGRQEGRYQQWDDSGRLVAEAEFSDGKPHGLSLAWHADGSLKAEARMQHGEVQERHFYAPGERREPSLMAPNPKPFRTAQLK
jgi:antitoxin component YwqK of YwqJK toxin-antitoxin module